MNSNSGNNNTIGAAVECAQESYSMDQVAIANERVRGEPANSVHDNVVVSDDEEEVSKLEAPCTPTSNRKAVENATATDSPIPVCLSETMSTKKSEKRKRCSSLPCAAGIDSDAALKQVQKKVLFAYETDEAAMPPPTKKHRRYQRRNSFVIHRKNVGGFGGSIGLLSLLNPKPDTPVFGTFLQEKE